MVAFYSHGLIYISHGLVLHYVGVETLFICSGFGWVQFCNCSPEHVNMFSMYFNRPARLLFSWLFLSWCYVWHTAVSWCKCLMVFRALPGFKRFSARWCGASFCVEQKSNWTERSCRWCLYIGIIGWCFKKVAQLLFIVIFLQQHWKFSSSEEKLFNQVTVQSTTCSASASSTQSTASQNYHLRPRKRDKELPEKKQLIGLILILLTFY